MTKIVLKNKQEFKVTCSDVIVFPNLKSQHTGS